MDTEILVAVISGIVAIICVIVTSVVTFLSARSASRAQKDLEEYKQRLAREFEEHKQQLGSSERSMEMTRNVIEHRIKILETACTYIQEMRDNVRRLNLLEKPSDKSSRLLLKNIGELDRKLVSLYGESHVAVHPLERKILHGVKDYAGEVARACTAHVEKRKPLPVDIEEYLKPLQNAQLLLIREYEKWNGLLLYNPDNSDFGRELFANFLFPLISQEHYMATRKIAETNVPPKKSPD